MSWSRRLRAGALGALCLALAGCGFQPLHGRGAGQVGAEALAGIEVPPLPDREGQLVHDHLTRGFNASGRAAANLYRLDIELAHHRGTLGLRRDQTATRANLTLSASFALVELATGKTVYRSHSSVTNSYNIVEQQFATVAAEMDSLERAALALADNIRLRVAAFLATRDTSGRDARPAP